MKVRSKCFFGILLLLFSGVCSSQKVVSDRSGDTVLSAIYLQPSAFPELPSIVVKDLEQRGCRIPQQAYTRKRTNVIRGEFARARQRDWAVLCSVQGTSRIMVYWNGNSRNPAETAPLQDSIFLHKDASGKFQFLRGIGAVGKEFILEHFRAYGGPTPPAIDHQGIDDAFIEKGSTTWYFYGGKWLKLTGAD